MKKFLIIITTLILILINTNLCFGYTTFEANCELGKYLLKSPGSNYSIQPLIEIREQNYLYTYNPGALVRTAVCNFNITGEFNLAKQTVEKIKEKHNYNPTIVGDIILENFAKILTKKEYIRKIHELKAILLLKNEVIASNEYFKAITSNTVYNKFTYHFYHYKVIQTDTMVPESFELTDHPINYGSKEYQEMMTTVRNELAGIYNQKIIVPNTEIRDGIDNINNINALLPINIKHYKQRYHPLFTYQSDQLDNEIRTKLIQAGNTKSIKTEKLNLYSFTFNKQVYDSYVEFFNLWNDGLLTFITLTYTPIYGYYNLDQYNNENLTTLLNKINTL